jgi:outer membrane protein OmpA-like peptidoglycan-associated protein
MSRFPLTRVALVGALLTALAPVWAQQAPLRDASVGEMVERLAPQPGGATTRSLRNLVPQKRELDLVVQFDFDSARLQAVSRPLLQNLADALATPRLSGTRFLVQGHTDAKGTAAYNDALSARRAQAVADFLQSKGIQADRLKTEGKGFSELLLRDQPEAPENRRVRIVAIE